MYDPSEKGKNCRLKILNCLQKSYYFYVLIIYKFTLTKRQGPFQDTIRRFVLVISLNLKEKLWNNQQNETMSNILHQRGNTNM